MNENAEKPSTEDQLNKLKEENRRLKERLRKQQYEKEVKEKEIKEKEKEVNELQEIIQLQLENKNLDTQIVTINEHQNQLTTREEKNKNRQISYRPGTIKRRITTTKRPRKYNTRKT